MGSKSLASKCSPVMGINSTLWVGDRQLHVRTEHLAEQQGCVVTHVVGDDGQIICVARLDHAEIAHADLRGSLLKAMRFHHLAVIQSVRDFTGEELAELRDWARAPDPAVVSIPPVSLRRSRVVTQAPVIRLVRPVDPNGAEAVSDHDRRLAAVASDEGFNLYQRGDLEGALLCWSRAVDLDPGNAAYRSDLERIRALLEGAPKT